ncbi:MAG: 30S ribosomal protein S4 [Candidatus Levybacteria bacterium RIFCSPHIGHO2_02_FULL_42_12]|nr:MAG: 30S ribosomal protein S4 [Candidatus Levybacteria bacterium RIFCSPHIGHO2_01_FULL_42_15]OGH31435.1 MAG: 30S ribosomal protein S4 [Candidatus Levybacteria bacterium RIFCSPHIGHO2_02_FULL_42_12]OGH42699.1 MAG: 30S ribosomal protein S4 [Candidatus Levybacteria bacterium RIFCSPLOWO2_01_FULL_42_15]
MARYTGPKHRLARREGVNILEKTSASLQRRLTVPPGVHGRRRRRRLSEFGQQLREKQKAKATYGMLEKQFSRLVKTVQQKRGDTAEMILGLLETRLDNIVYRLNFAKTRFMARQLVSHGHTLVDGKKVTIPSYQVKEGSIISLSSKMGKNSLVVKLIEENLPILPFLEREATFGKLVRMPTLADVQVLFDMQLIIEYYSR